MVWSRAEKSEWGLAGCCSEDVHDGAEAEVANGQGAGQVRRTQGESQRRVGNGHCSAYSGRRRPDMLELLNKRRETARQSVKVWKEYGKDSREWEAEEETTTRD